MTEYKYNFNEIEKLSIEIWKDIVIMNREALRLSEINICRALTESLRIVLLHMVCD